MDEADEDRKNGLVRTKYISVIPPSDPDFPGLFGRREDSESIHDNLKNKSTYEKRAHAIGLTRQYMAMIGYGLKVNSLALYLDQRRAPPNSLAA